MNTVATVWIPLVTAGAGFLTGVGAAMGTAILTQRRIDRREDVRWERERTDRQEQWQRERTDRQEQWQREDAQRWLRESQQLYASLITALDDWDDELRPAIMTLRHDAEEAEKGEGSDQLIHRLLNRKEIDTTELNRRHAAASQAMTMVKLIAHKPIRDLAANAISGYLILNLQLRLDTQDVDILLTWLQEAADRKSALLEAMQRDLGLDIPASAEL